MGGADAGRSGFPASVTGRNDRYNLLLYLFSCKSHFLVIKYINVATVRSNNPDADYHPGFLESLAAI